MNSVRFTTQVLLIGALGLAIGAGRSIPKTGMTVTVIVAILALVLAGVFEKNKQPAPKVLCELIGTTSVLVFASIVPFAMFFYAQSADLMIVAQWRYGLFVVCLIFAGVTWLLVGTGIPVRVRKFYGEMHWHVQEC
jgi:hypothetical protein